MAVSVKMELSGDSVKIAVSASEKVTTTKKEVVAPAKVYVPGKKKVTGCVVPCYLAIH